jgi:hypothetical protein
VRLPAVTDPRNAIGPSLSDTLPLLPGLGTLLSANLFYTGRANLANQILLSFSLDGEYASQRI